MTKSNKKKSKKNSAGRIVGKGLLYLVGSPYFIGKGIYKLSKKTKQKKEVKQIKKKRKEMVPVYEDFDIVKEHTGTFKTWEESVHDAESKIGIILGARGSGKSAFGIKFLENMKARSHKKCCAMGFKADNLPEWISVFENVEELPNDSVVLIDEGGILFSSRNAMSSANKLLSELILVARHKNLTILFISQNSSNLDINILRQADFLVLKRSSLLQKEFERKIIQKIYEKADEDFENFREHLGLTHIYSSNFIGFVSNPLPSFWKTEISKSFS